MPGINVTAELTDTFGGEANYEWVRRKVVNVPENASRKLIMRRAKAAVGMANVPGVTTDHGDTIEFRPYGMLVVMFVIFPQ